MADNTATEGYKILVFDLDRASGADKASAELAAVLADGSFSPTSQTFSPDGRFLIVTLLNNKKAAELLGQLLGNGGTAVPFGQGNGGGFGFGGGGLS